MQYAGGILLTPVQTLVATSIGEYLLACHFSKLNMVGVVQLAEHRIVVPGVVGSSPITHPIKKEISSDISFFIWYLIGNGTRIIPCNADERCRRRLDGAEHLFSPRVKMQTSPLPKSSCFTRPGRLLLLVWEACSLLCIHIKNSGKCDIYHIVLFCFRLY